MHWTELHSAIADDIAALHAEGLSDEMIARALMKLAGGNEPDPIAAPFAPTLGRLTWYLHAYAPQDDGTLRITVPIALATTASGGDGLAELLNLVEACMEVAWNERAKLPVDERADFYYNRGVDRMEKGDAIGAVIDFSAALEAKPDDLHALHNRGAAFQHLEAYEEAIEDWDRAIALDPRYAMAWMKRGLLRMGLGEEEALDDLKTALKVSDPEWTFRQELTALIAGLEAYEE